jgi:hypothetical protein
MVLLQPVGAIHRPRPAKLIIGMISADLKIFAEAQKFLKRKFGDVDIESKFFPFDKTDYYDKELGKNLQRKFLSFKNFVRPEQILEIKIFTNKLEKKFSKDSKRKINLDPGYITDSKLVLATTKDYSHRIYLGKGIYAEATLYFKDGSFRYFDWTYPDYRSPEYISFFNEVRRIYLEQVKTLR